MIICTKCICYVGRVKQASGLAVGVSAVDSVDCPCLWDTCPRASNNRHYREIKHGLFAPPWRMITKVTAAYSSGLLMCNKTSGFLFVHVRRVHSGWFERGIQRTLICFAFLSLEISQTFEMSAQRDRWGKKHAFLYVNMPCGLSVWRRGAFKLFFEWQLLSYCIICKNSFDRFNKWIAHDMLLKSLIKHNPVKTIS